MVVKLTVGAVLQSIVVGLVISLVGVILSAIAVVWAVSIGLCRSLRLGLESLVAILAIL